jgi:hypothetical protein
MKQKNKMIKKNNKSGKMTIDKLAIMVAKGFENTATRDDIKNIDKKIDTKVEELKNQIKGVDKRIDDFAENKVSKVTFKELDNRVSFMEKKFDIKKEAKI